MIFQLSKDQEVLRDGLRAVFGDLCAPARTLDLWRSKSCLDQHLWERLVSDGWLGIAIPESDGGSGLDVPELALLAEEVGHAGAIGPIVETALAGKIAASWPASASRDKLLSSIVGEGARVALALLPSRTGILRLSKDGVEGVLADGAVVLNGHCAFTPWAKAADILLIEARTDRGSALCLVDAKQPGVSVGETAAIDPGSAWGDVTLRDVSVPVASAMVPCPDDVIPLTAVLTSAALLGAAKRCLSLTVEYAKVRKQFGREIGSFQAVQHLCADMVSGIENLEPSVRYAASCAGAGSGKFAYFASVARLYAENVATMVWTNALQIHAGIGFSWEHELHIYLKRILALQAQYGSVDLYRDRIIRAGPAFAAA